MVTTLIKTVKNNLRIVIIALMLVFIFSYMASFVQSYMRFRQIDSVVVERQAELEKQQREQEELKQELEKITSTEYREQQAREKLGLVKENEIVVILPEEDILRKISPRTKSNEIPVLPLPNWKQWINVFFDI